jgi:hypothetical protein
MQGSDATIGNISFERGGGSGGSSRPLILGAFMAAAVGCIAAYALHARYAAPPARSQAQAVTVASEDPGKLFGEIIVEPEWSAALAQKPEPGSTLASLNTETAAAVPAPVATLAPSAEPAVPSAAPPVTANLLPDVIPLPPVRDVPRIDDSAPLPPARPAEFAEPTAIPVAPDRQVAQPSTPGAPADERNIFQKLLGIGQPGAQQPGVIVASRPPAQPVAPARPTPALAPVAAPAPIAAPAVTAVAKPVPGDSRGGGFASLFGFSASPSLDRLGYDRQTAIYVISARAVYMPDGTRLEAHSGLGAALDDLRYVSERAVGPTPPHLYELTMRESLFHGVQALRLNPVGDGGLYGRAGLLAHPYMLGPNGDSNGCVSVKDYDAFLRAYENGQIRKLAVVSSL